MHHIPIRVQLTPLLARRHQKLIPLLLPPVDQQAPAAALHHIPHLHAVSNNDYPFNPTHIPTRYLATTQTRNHPPMFDYSSKMPTVFPIPTMAILLKSFSPNCHHFRTCNRTTLGLLKPTWSLVEPILNSPFKLPSNVCLTHPPS